MKKSYLLLLTTLLTACSSTDNLFTDTLRTLDTQNSHGKILTSQLRSQQRVTVALKNLPFQLASLDSINRLDINAQSAIVHFPEGNSFVAALQLPTAINKFTFELESLIGQTVFVASVLFLDENFQELSRIDNVAYIDKKGFVIKKQFTTDSTASIRYIVVFSKDSHFDGKTELFDIIRDYEKNKSGKDLPISSYPIPYAQHSPIGHININFSNVFLAPVAILAKATTKLPATILTETESLYLQQISKAIKQGDLSRAKSLTEEAVRAGSTKALAHYIEALSKQ